MRLIHKSTGGALEIVGVEGIIEPGVPFEVTDEQAEGLLIQTDLYEQASDENDPEPEPAPEPKKRGASK